MKRFALAVAASLSGADAAWMSSQTSAIKPSLSNRAAASPIIRMSGGNAAEADVINALEAELATTRAEAWAARCEARDLKSALEAAKAQIRQLQLQSQPEAADDTDRLKESDADSKLTSTDAALFDAIDDNGDGVLTREEFTKGYALFLADVASESFDAIDADGNGELTREEFQKGFALLTSDSARAAAEREKVEAAVALARKEATREAALVLAEAELRDVLNAPPKPRRKKGTGLSAPPLRKWGNEAGSPYSLYGPLPDGFDAERAEALVAERCAAKAAKLYAKADVLQDELIAMGVRLDDRWRTWSCAAAIDEVKRNSKPQASLSGGRAAKRGGGRGGGKGRSRGPKRLSPGERRWREGAKPERRSAVAAATAAAAVAAAERKAGSSPSVA